MNRIIRIGSEASAAVFGSLSCDELRHKALLGAAKASGTSVQRLFDNFVTHVLAERQLEARFAARQNRGNPERGRRLLAEIRQRLS